MGGGSSSSTSSTPGSLSPVTAMLQALFGSTPPKAGKSGYRPTSFGGEGALFNEETFNALPGLLQNFPMTGTEQAITGGGAQAFGAQNAFGAQGLLQQGANALPALLETEPTAAIAAARRGFTQETVPSILERAPGFSSSDLQRELTRAGVDLETGIGAMREANLGRVAQTVQGLPAFAQAFGGQFLDQMAGVLGFGQLGREFMRDVSPAGDAFRVLTMLQSLTGPALTQSSKGKSSSVQIL